MMAGQQASNICMSGLLFRRNVAIKQSVSRFLAQHENNNETVIMLIINNDFAFIYPPDKALQL